MGSQPKLLELHPKLPSGVSSSPSFLYLRKPHVLDSIRRAVCRRCDEMTTKEILSLQEKNTSFMLKRGLQSNGKKWKTCAKIFGTGPRYWVCPDAQGCGRECTSTLHQEWERKGGMPITTQLHRSTYHSTALAQQPLHQQARQYFPQACQPRP